MGLWCCLLVPPLVWLPGTGLACAAEDPNEVVLLHAWEVDPDLDTQWYYGTPPNYIQSVDIDKLLQGDLQQRVEEAQQIIVKANRGPVEDRRAVLDAVLDALAQKEQNRVLRMVLVSAASSLVQDTEEAQRLWDALEGDAHARRMVEPRLKDWKSQVALDRWRQVLAQPIADVRYAITVLEGIAAVGSSADADLVRRVLLSDGAVLPVQLAAATSLGQLQTSGLEELAGAIADSDIPRGKLLAVRLLARHTGSAAAARLNHIIDVGETAEQSLAYQVLASVDASAALQRAEAMLEHPDSTARRTAIDLLDAQQDVRSLNLQAALLADRNVHIRRQVRENLRRKAAHPELRQAVEDIVRFHLQGDRFEGIEQAVVLVSQLQLHSLAPRLLELVDHPREEVHVRAAWALQTLQLQPEVLEAISQRAERITARLERDATMSFTEEITAAFLFEALGRHRYRPADRYLRKYIPKADQKMRVITRTSAIYALGKIWEGSRDKGLADKLAARMLDDNPLDPEEITVQYASAIALGRIRHPSSIAQLERVPDDPPIARGVAAVWSIEQIRQASDGE
ncbi:MAG: hypothetical protein D6753_02800 [Planctomycetota bacterium]|nr:MAG: hypothetical protein D6753_02800 [Planctomycetota bacterium]